MLEDKIVWLIEKHPVKIFGSLYLAAAITLGLAFPPVPKYIWRQTKSAAVHARDRFMEYKCKEYYEKMHGDKNER